jgi:hypothetical protein
MKLVTELSLIVEPGTTTKRNLVVVTSRVGAEPRTPIDAVMEISPLVVNRLAENDNL